MNGMKYVVTAVNRLTGEREAISSPHAEWKAYELLAKARDMQRRSGSRSAWLRPRVEPAQTELKFVQQT